MKTNFWFCGVLGLGVASGVAQSFACLTMSVDNGARVNEEKTLIVWDEKTKTQHFVRKMRFDGASGAVGFLVPTPSEPELVALSDNAFEPALDAMARLRIDRVKTVTISTKNRAPRRETVRERVIGKIPFDDGRVRVMSRSLGTRSRSLSVVKIQRVGPFEAATLAGDNAGEIVAWLEKNGFSISPTAQDWLQTYATRGWKITAFKFAAPDAERDVSAPMVPLKTATIRLSFRTDAPFYPYREPKRGSGVRPVAPEKEMMGEDEGNVARAEYEKATPRFAPRSLDVYFLASNRTNAAVENGYPIWNATVRWAGPVARVEAERARWATALGLPVAALPATPYLTTFIDNTQQRPDGDLLFAPAKIQGDVIPPPLITYRTETVRVP